MSAYIKLKQHLDRYAYKRGRNKGDAPADASRRAKTNFRVIRGNGGQMIVRFHGTDILSAYEDGHIVLDTNGWHSSPTTRKAMTIALGFTGHRGFLYSKRIGGFSQTAIHLAGNTYRYYDQMMFDADGSMWGDPISFSAKRTDREETAEFRKEIKESGFVGVFPVLYEAATPEQGWVSKERESMCSEHMAHNWPAIVAHAKYKTWAARSKAVPTHEDHKAALKALIASHTRTMTKIVNIDVTVL